MRQLKTKMENSMTKKQMVDTIYRQNDVIATQSSQLLELISLANTVEKDSRSDEIKKCNSLKQENDVCTQVKEIQNHQLMIYDTSTRVQIILFILLLVLFSWILYVILYSKK
jgi:hypothetical protein